MILAELAPLTPDSAFLDIVLDVLREVEVDADEFLVELVLQLVDQLVLGQADRPLVERL